jgi:hypothetical protein
MGGKHVIQDRLHHGRLVSVGVALIGGARGGNRSEGSVEPDSIDRLTGFLQADNVNVPDMLPGRLPALLPDVVKGGVSAVDVHQQRQPLAGVVPPRPPPSGISVV